MSQQDESRKMLGNARLIALLREVDLDTAQANGDHIADDPELLERWDNQLLTDEEHLAILKHLAGCYECSQFLHDMTRAGVFGNTSSTQQTADAKSDALNMLPDGGGPTVSRPVDATHNSGTRSTRWFAMTTLACGLIAMVGFLISRGGNSPAEVRLAQADLGQLLHYLHEADFAAVVLPGAIKSGTKPYPVLPNAERDAKILRLAEMVKSEPGNLTLRLNLGQLLLEAGRHADALAAFQAAQSLNSVNSYVQLGLGMAQFRSGDIPAAERTFAGIENDTLVGVEAKVNRVLCLMALDKVSEARKLWTTLPADAQNERIGRFLTSAAEEEF